MSGEQDVAISFEVFPGRSDHDLSALVATVRRLAAFAPEFVSVTYGAAGSTREHTLITLEQLSSIAGLSLAGHLTCVAASREDTEAVARTYLARGISRIVALRGDPPRSLVGDPWPGFASARDLVAALARLGDVDISVAAYPETHPLAPSREACIDNLKAKFDAGAGRAITQFFFDNDDYFAFLDRARARGVDAAIVPGVMLITDFFRVAGFAARCGARVPEALRRRFADAAPGTPEHGRIAEQVALEQVDDLYRRGVREFHFYTMNRAALAEAVCRRLRQPAACCAA